MKPIKITLYNGITDAYYYMGQLFLLTNQRQLKTISNDFFFQQYLQTDDRFDNMMLKNIFFSNDKLIWQRDYELDLNYADSFRSFWKKYENAKFDFNIEDRHLTLLCDLPEQEGIDFVLYAQRAYLANRDGMFECRMSFEGNNVVAKGNFTRVLDAKSININPRGGHLLVSTKSEGLFSASLSGFESELRVGERPIEESSARTGWVNYNFVNYRSQTEAELFINEVEEPKSSEENWLSIEDNIKKGKTITKLASEREDITGRIAEASKKEEVIFSFNSLSKSFAVTETGSILYSSFIETEDNGVYLGNYNAFKDIRFDIGTLGRPLSAHTVSNGTVYEFFDQVLLVKNGKIDIVSDIECQQVRTFASSKWFQNIVLAIGEDRLEISSVFPYYSTNK